MKKFICNLIIFSLIICVIVLGINVIYVKKNVKYEADKFRSVPTEIEICNFGSSHGSCDFKYDDITNYTCFNFGLTSQTLSYDYRILYYYQDKISKNAVVFIPISYFSFWVDETSDIDFQSKNRRYYTFLPNDLIKNYDLKTDIYENCLPALTAYWKLPEVLFTRQETLSTMPKVKTALDIDVEADALAAYERHITNNLDAYGNRAVNWEELNSLYAMIDLCRAIDAEPILITVPYLSEYTDIIEEKSPDFYTDFYSILGTVMSEKEVVYYDYARDERFCTDYSLFSNVDHLNMNGAQKFVAILMEEILRKNENQFEG